MRKEFTYLGGTIAVFNRTNSLCITAPGFEATLAELKVLASTAEGHTHEETAQALGIKKQTSKDTLVKLRSRNTNGDERPTLELLVAKAYNLELLFPLTLNRLETVFEESKKK